MNKLKMMIVCGVALTVIPLIAAVYYDVANGYEWCFTPVAGGVEICRNGAGPCFSPYPASAAAIPSELGEAPVKSIGAGAFSNCTHLAEITLPGSITSIGNNAFHDCSGLESIRIPASVTSIGARAFYRCLGLTRIEFDGNAPTIQSADCFRYVNSACTVYVNSSSQGWNVSIPGTWKGMHIEYKNEPVLQISADGVLTKVTLNGVTELPLDGQPITAIGPYAFRNCAELTAVSIPPTVTSIASGAFSYCPNIREVMIGQSVCDQTMRIVFPQAYQSITNAWIYRTDETKNVGSSAFDGCAALAGIVIPPSVTNIGAYAFRNCSNLTSVVIGGLGVTNVGYAAFQNCVRLERINIPDCVTSIGSYAFQNCTSLESISVPNSEASVGAGAFSGCTNLVDVTLPNGLTTLSANLFKDCTSLVSITIPASVSIVGSLAFGYCNSLTNIAFCGDKPAISGNPFYGVASNCTIYVPLHWNNGWADTCNGLPVVRAGGEVEECQQGAATYKLISGRFLYDIVLNGETSFVVPDGVERIDNNAFDGCRGLESIEIPSSVCSIGQNAFRNCSKLREVRISDVAAWCTTSFDNNYSSPFYYAKALYINDVLASTLTIPEGVETLHAYAFRGCTNITVVTIPATLRTNVDQFVLCKNVTDIVLSPDNPYYKMADGVLIDADASNVYFCSRGKTGFVALPATATTIASYAFRDCGGITGVSIPEGVTRINQYAFSGCASLADIVIPQSVTYIGSYAFYGCEALTSINIPAGVTKLGSSDTYSGTVFQNCTGIRNATVNQYVCSMGMKKIFPDAYQAITNVVITDGVMTIGKDSFFSCTYLESVAMPNGVTSIGDSAFCLCENLKNITLPSTVTSIEDYAFYGCCELEGLDMPNGVTAIGNSVFGNCIKLDRFEIPNAVLSIGTNAFRHCYGIKSIAIPDNVTTIRYGAFSDCGSLEIVKLGSGVEEIEYGAFSVCGSLSRIYFDGNAPSTVESSAFPTRSLIIYVNTDSSGWGVDIPGTWNGKPIRYMPMETLSDDANPTAVNLAISQMSASGLSDVVGVRAAIGGSVAKYKAFKEWADNVKNTRGVLAGEDAAIANTNAAAAFLLGAERLFENAPAIEMGDVVVAKSATLQEGGTSVTLSVTVKDGENAVVCVAEKVKEMFEATTDLAEWNGTAKLEPTVTVVDDGDSTAGDGCVPMRFMVVPGDGTATRAFLRVKVK